MKPNLFRRLGSKMLSTGFLLAGLGHTLAPTAAPAAVLFEDDFNRGIPGWTSVLPAGGSYIDGPLLWQYDIVSQAFLEQSNIYTDSSVFSVTRTAPMLINDTVAPASFTYTARLTAGDDDAFGLIWGYQSEDTFYRVTFARQNRLTVGWPFQGWAVDRVIGGAITDLFGAGTQEHVPSFVNTSLRPFDVTLSVSDNRLTLTVVDDPEGSPISHTLVDAQPLPGDASGRVGLFTWGQSGTALRGFRISNPVLAPTPLTGNPNQLTEWTPLITPRADGTTTLGAAPIWSLAMDPNGATGTLIENGDAFGDNTTAGTTNFAAGSLVAGDVTWSNYLYTARLSSSDDDGFGMLLRFKDEMNFYRIAFRAQNSQAGVKRGLSVQKNVNLVFDEVFATDSFIPPINRPMDVHASIRDQRLQIVVVTDPDSETAQGHYFGPIDITGDTVDTGKIGIFSWAQLNSTAAKKSGTEADHVRVQELAGEGLIVSSPFGSPEPPVGLNDLAAGTVVTARVANIVEDTVGTRRINLGWDGAGSVPASGTANEVVFTLDGFSLLSWKWRTEHLLTTAVTGGGTVSLPAESWIAEGSNVTVVATADAGNVFAGWSGDSVSTVSNLSLTLSRPVTLTAVFVTDSDNDRLPDIWETTWFGNLAQAADGDPDMDGRSNIEEFRGGTNPKVAETLALEDGLTTRWINTQRDPLLPGILSVVDFGDGYRGAYDTDNDNRFGNDASFINATNLADFASFQSPIVVVRTNFWDGSWAAEFSASIEFTVGDNDGNCFYFRYVDEDNWFRVTLCGEAETATRPRLGISVQRRLNGVFSEVPGTVDPGLYSDPVDTLGYKRVKLTVSATNDTIQVSAIGWNAFLTPPEFDPASERVVTFVDPSLPSGRIGFGFWGQGAFGGPNATNGIPIPSGAMADNIVVRVGGTNAFVEDWENVPLRDEIPTGWTNAYAGIGSGTIEGDWRMSAHGTFMQLGNFGGATTGTSDAPKADVDGPLLVGPVLAGSNYVVQVGFHPFDDDGIGFVYDFQDTNNFSRVLFVSEATADGRVPQGLNVSRKVNGVWTDLVVGDNSFVYTPGSPFEAELSFYGTEHRLTVRNHDGEEDVFSWRWTAPAVSSGSRIGLACWGQSDAHFLHARALDIAAPLLDLLRITGAAVSGGMLTLDVSDPVGGSYDVELTPAPGHIPWSVVAPAQTGAQWSTPHESGPTNLFFRLKRAE